MIGPYQAWFIYLLYIYCISKFWWWESYGSYCAQNRWSLERPWVWAQKWGDSTKIPPTNSAKTMFQGTSSREFSPGFSCSENVWPKTSSLVPKPSMSSQPSGLRPLSSPVECRFQSHSAPCRLCQRKSFAAALRGGFRARKHEKRFYHKQWCSDDWTDWIMKNGGLPCWFTIV